MDTVSNLQKDMKMLKAQSLTDVKTAHVQVNQLTNPIVNACDISRKFPLKRPSANAMKYLQISPLTNRIRKMCFAEEGVLHILGTY